MGASRVKRWATGLALAVLAAVPARADRIGVVVMHGKLGVALGTSNGRGPATGGELVAALESAGYLVAAPEMCWSRFRAFDKPYADCLAELEPVIADLRRQGATSIVVGGLSLGGNAALVFGATHGSELAGVIGLAPADDPARKMRRPEVAAALERARGLVAAGKGGERALFADVNTGPQGVYAMQLDTTAAIYLSFFDPNGPAAIAATVAKVDRPLLWVAGDRDPTQTDAETAYYAHAPSNPKSKYVRISANHIETPDAGKDAVLQWLATLGK